MALLMFLNACSTTPLEEYTGEQPILDLQEYFTGDIKAWGIIQDRKGKVTRRFDVKMTGSWQDNVGTLEEYFDYYDGEKQKRVWTITKLENDQYEGTADDIIDKATGQLNGNAMRWAYQMDLTVGNNTYRITFDDWMFLDE